MATTELGAERYVSLTSFTRGRVRAGTEVVPATAEVVTCDGFEPVRAAVAGKYRPQFAAISLWGRLATLIGKGSGTDSAVVITPDD